MRQNVHNLLLLRWAGIQIEFLLIVDRHIIGGVFLFALLWNQMCDASDNHQKYGTKNKRDEYESGDADDEGSLRICKVFDTDIIHVVLEAPNDLRICVQSLNDAVGQL